VSFIEELRRRNMFKVAITYAIGAWLLLQLTEVLSELLTLPEGIGPVVVSIVLIGFPVVMILAWAFELTPDGVKREKDVDRSQSITDQTGKKLNSTLVAMLVLAVGYIIFDKFSGPEPVSTVENSLAVETASGGAQQGADPTADSSPAISPKSIAVLPFENRSRNEDDEFFVAGVHDDLLTNLARIGSLKVISRTSVSKYKETEKTIPEIAVELGVATVMEGAVQRSGDTIRINVQLIDAQTDEHLWAEIFDREMTANNLFAIQTEISERIAEALKTTLSPAEQERISDRPTENLAAYNAFLRGRLLQSARNSKDLDTAAIEFGRAVDLDPEFALAWVGVADTALLRVGYSNLGRVEAQEIREEAVAKALELNSQLGEAHLSQAMLHRDHERWEEAEVSFLKALELSPNYARAYQWYADFVAIWPSRTRESLRLTRQAVELDPLSSILQCEIVEKMIILGQFVEEQVIWMRKKLDLDPGDIQEYQNLAFAMLDLGSNEAIADIRKKMEEIDDEHFSLGFVDIFEALNEKNYKGALEGVNWLESEFGQQPSFQGFFGFLHTLDRDYEKARASFELAEPRFFERSTFRAAIEQQSVQGCLNAWLMMHTGDEKLGRELLDMTISYIENELPKYVDHADRFGFTGCYLASGDNDKAISTFETWADHGHISGWWINTNLPWFEPIRGEPRFEAAIQGIRDRMTLQRENLARLDEEAGP
jgi:TolB-like protein